MTFPKASHPSVPLLQKSPPHGSLPQKSCLSPENKLAVVKLATKDCINSLTHVFLTDLRLLLSSSTPTRTSPWSFKLFSQGIGTRSPIL